MATQGVTAVRKRRTLVEWLKGYTGQKYMTTALFLAIPVALLILFTIIPAVNMVIFSFQQRDQLGVNVQWVGFDNYKTLFTDMSYLSTLINSLYYFVGSFIQLGLALFIATLLCSKIKLAGLFKGVIFFPYLMNGVAVALIFQRFFRGDDGGTLNSIISLFGADPVKWLSNGAINNWCLVFASVWRYIGFDILMFIGAIQSISPDIYEAADLDGANAWQKFWHIIFPVSGQSSHYSLSLLSRVRLPYLRSRILSRAARWELQHSLSRLSKPASSIRRSDLRPQWLSCFCLS